MDELRGNFVNNVFYGKIKGHKNLLLMNYTLTGKPRRPGQAGRRAPDPARESVF
jgi:hypothetical protein